jgi:serine/threonine protein kinase
LWASDVDARAKTHRWTSLLNMLAPGRIFGRYRIVREVGRGGMGAVFAAEHLSLKKRVALKTLHAGALDSRSIERFLREGKAAASLRHPHVVDVWDLGVEEGTPYLVMELLEGEDLAQRLRREAPLPLQDAIDLILPVCAAVEAMHEAGIVHRDIKPENVFLARGLGAEVLPKVLDFGVCRPSDVDVLRKSEAGLVGTPYYLSPEQVEGAAGDAQSDQHALAVVLYECLCGARPYEAPTLLALLAAIRDARAPDVRSRRGDAPSPLAEALQRAMHRDPAERFASVARFAEALLPFASARAQSRWSPIFAPSSEPSSLSPSTSPGVDRRADAADSYTPQIKSPVAETLRFGTPSTEPPSQETGRPRGARRAKSWLALAVFATSLAALGVARGRSTVGGARPSETKTEQTRSEQRATRSIESMATSPSAGVEEPRVGAAPDNEPLAGVVRESAGDRPRASSSGPPRATRARSVAAGARRATPAPLERSSASEPSATREAAVNGAPIVD